MRNQAHWFAFIAAALVSPIAAAQWSPTAELGFVATQGNTDTVSLNGRFGLTAESDRWTHDYYLSGLRAEQDQDVTASRLELAGKSARKFGERSYAGAALRYENDRFGPYRQQGTLAMNVGFWALRDEQQSLQLEGGPGYRRAQSQLTREWESDLVVRAFGDYRRQLTDSTELLANSLVEAAGDNTFVRSELGLGVRINSSLALKAAVQARYNSEVEPGRKSMDTQTTLNIVWQRK